MGFILVVNLIAMTIVPTLIMPLFNKFTPLEDGELKTAIEKLALEQKFPLTKLFVIDGSKDRPIQMLISQDCHGANKLFCLTL